MEIELLGANTNNDDDDDVVVDDDYRNWADDLPDLVFDCILSHLSSSTRDLFTLFFTVCHSWRRRSLATSTPPPLFLCCNKPFRYWQPFFLRYRQLSQMLSLSRRPIECSWMSHLRSPARDRRFFKSMIVSPRTLNMSCIGSSHGHLIFASRCTLVLANVFSGNEITSPLLPHNYRCTSAILTAKPSSSTPSVLVLAASRLPPIEHGGYDILCWRVGTDDNWSVLQPDIGANLRLSSLLVFNGQVICLLSDASLLVIDFSKSLKHVRVQLPSDCNKDIGTRGGGEGMVINMQRLVECGGEVLIVRFITVRVCQLPPSSSIRIKIFRLLLNSSSCLGKDENVWAEEVESIGNWCLFLNSVGECSPACYNPIAWGGKSNCIYIPAYDCQTWTAHLLDGTQFDSSCLPACRWPTSFWVYPSML